MVDVHCHIGTDLTDEKIIRIVNGTNLDSSQEVVYLAEKHKNVWACVGVHPEEIDKIYNVQFTIYNELQELIKYRRVVGIGEVGLDYFQGIIEEEKNKQKELLEIQLQLAEKYQLPAEIHNRAADDDIWELIKKYKITGVMHCFTRNTEFMKRCAGLGWYFSFGGFVINKNNNRMRQVTAAVPENRLLLETDSPYAAADVKIIAGVIAGLRGINEAEVDRITSENAQTLFKKMV